MYFSRYLASRLCVIHLRMFVYCTDIWTRCTQRLAQLVPNQQDAAFHADVKASDNGVENCTQRTRRSQMSQGFYRTALGTVAFWWKHLPSEQIAFLPCIFPSADMMQTQICGTKGIQRVDFGLRRRVCTSCMKDKYVP
jgi:hypothetical protein